MRISEANKLRILYFLVFCCTAAWLPIFADFLKDSGLKGVQIGIVLSVAPVMMFVVQPFYGMLADKLGYKKCLLFSSLFAGLGYLLFLFGGGFSFVFLITVLMAFFYNALQPLLDSLSLKLVQENPRFSYGSLRIAGAAGWALTGIVTGYFIDLNDTTVIFVIAAICMFLCFLFALLLNRDNASSSSLDLQSFKNVRLIFLDKTLLFLLLCVFLVSAGATTIWNFYSIYMKENGASAQLVGYGLSFQGVCELPLFYFSARIIGRLGIKTTLIITVFATALRLLLYSLVSNPRLAIPIELLHGLSWSLFWVACVEYVNKLVKIEWRATGQSLLYAAYFGAGAIVGNLWTGFLYESKMRIAEIFLMNAGIVTLVALLLWFFMKRERKMQVA